MRYLTGDVDRMRMTGHRVEVLGVAFPVPLDALVQRGAGDVLDAFHQRDQPLVLVGTDGGESDAAIAHHGGGHTLPARRRQVGIPRDLAVIVRVDVDEAGCHQQTRGIDLVAATPGDGADRTDAVPVDRNVSLPWRGAGAVDDHAPTDHQIVISHSRSPLLPVSDPR